MSSGIETMKGFEKDFMNTLPHGFYSTGGILVVKIPSKKEKCVSGDSFAITYPTTFRFCRLTVGNSFLFLIMTFVSWDISWISATL